MDCRDKIIEIDTPFAQTFKPGEEVIVSLAQNLGMWAVFLVYILPLLLLLGTLFAVSAAGGSEISSGISAIIILIPYYFWIFLNKKKLAGKFRFTISKATD